VGVRVVGGNMGEGIVDANKTTEELEGRLLFQRIIPMRN